MYIRTYTGNVYIHMLMVHLYIHTYVHAYIKTINTNVCAALSSIRTYVCTNVRMYIRIYVCMVVCIYVRTSTAGTHSFLQPARHFVNCILVLAGLLPLLPVGRAPGSHATHVHTYVHTCVRYTHTHKLRHRHCFSLGHSLE